MRSTRHGFVRTMEAFLAMALTFAALMFLFPASPESRREVAPVLQPLLYDETFRACAVEENVSCLNATVRPLLPATRSFVLNLTQDPANAPQGLPAVRIDTESVAFATNASLEIVRLYSWVAP